MAKTALALGKSILGHVTIYACGSSLRGYVDQLCKVQDPCLYAHNQSDLSESSVILGCPLFTGVHLAGFHCTDYTNCQLCSLAT